MKGRDYFITLNFIKKQIQTSLVMLYIELTHMYTIFYKSAKYPKALASILQLILIAHNNFIYYQKSTRIHITHQEHL